MKAFLLLLVPTILAAQARSTTVIKVHKPSACHCDSVRTVVVHDTIVKRDTVIVPIAISLGPDTVFTKLLQVDTVKDHGLIPIPIPIPLRRTVIRPGDCPPPQAMTATPEPSTLMLVGTAFFAGLWWRRKTAGKGK